MYGWFSEKAAEYGTSIYKTPEGKEVEVTLVQDSEILSTTYKWEDVIPVGEVTQYLRQGRPRNYFRF